MKLPLLIALLGTTLLAHAELTEEQRRVPLEVEPPNPGLAKVVLIAGSVSNKPGQHEYFAGCALMADWLRQSPGVWPVLAAEGWPKNEAILRGAKAIVVYADGGVKLPFLAPERWALMKEVIEGGAGFVMLHQSVDTPADHAEEMQSWLGGAFVGDIGCRGHWDMEFSDFPKHPITRGLTAFAAPLDGWLYNLHFAPGVVPLLRGTVPEKSRTSADAKTHPDRAETVAWAYERPKGGRSFAFTGCDLHRNWSVESQRRLVVNGILWAAGLEVPAEGAPVRMAPAVLTANMDAKSPSGAPLAPAH
jgi:type 1 glutamine amidotransferase